MKKTIEFNHLGFPIVIVNCPHLEIEGELIPDINYKALERALFEVIPHKPSQLNGAEIKFIRTYLKMTQLEFGNWLDDKKDASTITKWESKDLESTQMDSSMERSLRLQLIGYTLDQKRRKTLSRQLLKEISNSLSSKAAVEIKIKESQISRGSNLALEPSNYAFC